MNKIRNIMFAGFMLTLLYTIPSCTKHDIAVNGELATGAKLAFVQASEKSASVAFYANGEKISSTAVLASGVYGGSNAKGTRFPQSDYSVFPVGTIDLSTFILGKVITDSIKTSSISAYPIEENKTYTYYYYDNPDGTQTAKVIQDDMGTLDVNQASVRFVNLVTNAANNIKLIVSTTSESPAPTLPYTLFDGQAFETISSAPFMYNFSGSTISYTLKFEVWYTGTPAKKLVEKTSEIVTRGRTYTVVAFGSRLGTVGFLKFMNKAY